MMPGGIGQFIFYNLDEIQQIKTDYKIYRNNLSKIEYIYDNIYNLINKKNKNTILSRAILYKINKYNKININTLISDNKYLDYEYQKLKK